MVKEEKRRDVYIDILRIFACLMVIFNHSNERGFYRFLNVDKGPFLLGGGYLLCAILCKSAVPVFLMISGTMLLRKEEAVLVTYKRLPKMLIDLIGFSLFYFWIESRLAGEFFSFFDTLQRLLQNNYWHMWYLYAYIAFIITLPFFRKFMKGLDVKSSIYLFIVSVIVMGILPIAEYFLIGINGNLKPSWITEYIFIYPALGYVVDQVWDIKSVKRAYIGMLWIVNILCLATSGVCEYFFLIREPGNVSEMFLVNFCPVNAVTVFLTIKYLFAGKEFGKYAYKIITETGKCTFGIYLLHIWFLWKSPFFYNIWMRIEQGTMIGKNIGIFLSCILVLAIAGLNTYILRKIPLIHKLF